VIRRASVDLPEPLGPTTATISPATIVALMPRRIGRVVPGAA
jgi:hypothetical protein